MSSMPTLERVKRKCNSCGADVSALKCIPESKVLCGKCLVETFLDPKSTKERHKKDRAHVAEIMKEIEASEIEEQKQKVNEYQKTHQDEIKAYRKEFNQKHAIEIKEYQKTYQEQHKEQLKQYRKEYYRKRHPKPDGKPKEDDTP